MPTNRFQCDPSLSGNLTAEYTALQNDLEQARCLAVDYQNQLSDKSNALATLKITLERTSGDLEKLQAHILALREERHRLANECMRVVALEFKVANLTEELKRLRETQREILRENARPFIQMESEVPETIELIPTAVEPRAAGHNRR
jgi:chromosome segregation ATPase